MTTKYWRAGLVFALFAAPSLISCVASKDDLAIESDDSGDDEEVGQSQQALHGCTGSMPKNVTVSSLPADTYSPGDQYDDNGASCTGYIIEYTTAPTVTSGGVTVGQSITTSTECNLMRVTAQKWSYNGSWTKNGEMSTHGVWDSGTSTCNYVLDSGSSDPGFTAGTKWRVIAQGYISGFYNGTAYTDFKRVHVGAFGP